MQTHVYNDFDAFAESVHNVDSRMLLRHPKNRTWSVSTVNLNGINIQVGRLGSGNIAQGEIRQDGYILYLPLTDAVEYSANGIVLEKKSFALLEPGCEFCISTKEEHDWCVAFVPSHMFALETETVEPLPGFKGKTCRVTRPNRLAADRFQSLTGQIMAAASKYSQFESTSAASCAAAEVLKIVSSYVGQPQNVELHPRGRTRLSRQEIIRRCNELLKASHNKHVFIEELAVAAQVSQRTLRTAYNEYFGVGPVQYLQLRKLHQVRRALTEADSKANLVSDILMGHGEWELGRFATRYRRLFGELPSETLRGNGGNDSSNLTG